MEHILLLTKTKLIFVKIPNIDKVVFIQKALLYVLNEFFESDHCEQDLYITTSTFPSCLNVIESCFLCSVRSMPQLIHIKLNRYSQKKTLENVDF